MDPVMPEAATTQETMSISTGRAGLRVLRWLVLLPAFAILVLMTANITLGFAAWFVTKGLSLQIVLIPAGLVLLALNGLGAYISCLIAPGRRTAAILLSAAYIAGMAFSYSKFDWPALTAAVFGIESIAVLAGLFIAGRR